MDATLDDPAELDLADFSDYETDRADPRAALMWPVTGVDVARIATAVHAAGEKRVVDVGAGSGLLAHLLSDVGLRVIALDPNARDADAPVGRFHPVRPAHVQDLPAPPDAALVSWMEAGEDYRAPVAEAADVVVQAVDVGGGCGDRGRTGFERFGFQRVAHWLTASFENVAYARRTRGRGKDGGPLPRALGNRVEVWARHDGFAARLRRALTRRRGDSAPAYAWEPELRMLGLHPTPVHWNGTRV